MTMMYCRLLLTYEMPGCQQMGTAQIPGPSGHQKLYRPPHTHSLHMLYYDWAISCTANVGWFVYSTIGLRILEECLLRVPGWPQCFFLWR